jgi:hypothetical protein
VEAEVDSPLDVTRYNNTNANFEDGVQLGTWTYTGKSAVSNCAGTDGYARRTPPPRTQRRPTRSPRSWASISPDDD